MKPLLRSAAQNLALRVAFLGWGCVTIALDKPLETAWESAPRSGVLWQVESRRNFFVASYMDSIHYPLSISRLDYSRICFGDWDGLKPTSHQSEQLRPNGRLSWQRTWWTFGDLAMWGSSSHNATYYKSISNYIRLQAIYIYSRKAIYRYL